MCIEAYEGLRHNATFGNIEASTLVIAVAPFVEAVVSFIL